MMSQKKQGFVVRRACPIMMAGMDAPAGDYQHRITPAGGDILQELVRLGWARGRPAILAATEKPQLLASVISSFLDSGVEIVITPTASANMIQARHARLDKANPEQLNREATKICCEAVGQYPVKGRQVFGAIGPVEPLLTLKEISEKELAECYRGQAGALLESGVHGILCSRFSELEALRIAVEAVRSITSLPVVAGLAFGSGPDLTETALGCSVAQLCASVRDLGLLAVAVDSDRNPDALAQILAHVKSNTDLPIWVSCDAGYPQIEEAGVTYSDRPAEYAARYKGIAALGVSYFEAGYGAGLAHVSAITAINKPHKSRVVRGIAADQAPEFPRS